MNLLVIFITGLTTGGLSCLAMQGGLLASIIANQKDTEFESKSNKKNFKLKSFDELDWMPVGMFLVAKLFSHLVLGFLLGALGSVITLSLGMRLSFQIFAAFFMFATAMNLLDVHPAFRFVSFQPPKFLQKIIRNSSKSKALFAPAILGLLTVFIPCGVTQAMEVLAINTGSPVQGAAIMFAFMLGTTPFFAIVGVATAKLSEAWHEKFSKVAAYALVAMAIYSVNGVALVMGSPITLQRVVRPVTWFFSKERFANSTAATVTNGVQRVTINVEQRGYSPNYFQVQRGVPVELTLNTSGVYSCATDFTFREFGIYKQLKPSGLETFTFTPTKKGRFTFACSMGMYSGVMEVL
ncbi:MAG: sulfite exporter TauE/SafE family protein [Patescibacteria group bacterium]